MKLLVCGSGASEAVPALFCTCDLCRQAWQNGGKDIRSRTSYALGDEIKIDFGPDALLHREKYNLHYERMKHLFITHPHLDHFTPSQLNNHVNAVEGPAILSEHTLTLHGTKEVLALFQAELVSDFSKMRMKLDELNPEKDVRVLENGIKVTSIYANHLCKGAVNYVFEIPNMSTVFIGTDSALFEEKTWRELRNFKLDVVILDATAGMLEIENGSHANARQAVYTAERMRNEGIASGNCRIFTNHFAHCAKMLHKDLEDFFEPYNITPAYDGLYIDL